MRLNRRKPDPGYFIPLPVVRLAINAMGTRFELVLTGASESSLRAAGEVALDEIARAEAALSPYNPTSQVAHINLMAAERPVKVTPEVFALLQRAKQVWESTQGAFDVTVGALVECWGIRAGRPRTPRTQELATARARLGMDKLVLDERELTVRFKCRGVALDLGAIGKGYAIDAAVAVLRDAGVTSAFIHAGTSTMYGLGAAPGGGPWRVAVAAPPTRLTLSTVTQDAAAPGTECSTRAPVCILDLDGAALSVSAVWGRAAPAFDGPIGHIVDPRTGELVRHTLLSAVTCPSATDADALSTALVVLGPDGLNSLVARYRGIRALVVCPDRNAGGFKVRSVGIESGELVAARGANA
ncbi:MAG: FAD:protein FMN transferase [Verrucomicrobiales bacterium]|nr:FAD:protein FMN transferase [Verrucomicrobiales bacterium]